jgi:hypothetical protein
VACTSSAGTITASPSESSTAAPSMAPSASTERSPSANGLEVDAACVALVQSWLTLRNSLKGQTGNSTVDDMATIAKKLYASAPQAPSISGQLDSSFIQLADEAQHAANYNGSDVGELSRRIRPFIQYGGDFIKTYC